MTEAVAVEDATATDTATLAPRAPYANVRSLRGGNVVAVASETAPNDPAQDVPMYFDAFHYDSEHAAWNGYLLREADGEAETWVTQIAAERIMSVINSDHYAYKQAHKWKVAAGKFAVVAPSYLPAGFRETVNAAGKKMPRYKTYLEVLSVEGTTVTARVFSNESTTAEAVEYGTAVIGETEAVNIMGNCQLYKAEDFRGRFGLATEVWPVGSVHTYDSKTYVMQSAQGDTALFAEVDDDTAEVVPGRSPLKLASEYSRTMTKVADSLQAMKDAMPTGEALEALMLLSRNTVTRALKHADSNNYCSETAVALTSAGHVMPEVRIKGTITIPVNVSSKEYMLLRRMFGLANSDVSNLDAVLKQHYSTIAENVRELPKIGKLPAGATMDLQTEVVWKSPKLRPLN